MRKINVFNSVSLDGYFAGPNGEMDWFPHSEESMRFSEESSSSSGIMIFGHTTYQMMESFWPTAEAEKMAPITASSLRNNPKIVFSRTLQKVEDKPKWKNITILHGINHDEIIKLKEQEGKDFIILGSGSIVRQFTNLGLIDEYMLMVYPVIIGSGMNLFKDVKRVNLKLADTKTFNNGNVLLTYKYESK